MVIMVNTHLLCTPEHTHFNNELLKNRVLISLCNSIASSPGPQGTRLSLCTIIFPAAGRAGWGYSWYINGTLIPRLIVSRGYTYTFISEGGDDPGTPSQYHPFYLTSSVIGGRLGNTEAQREVCV